MTSLSAASNDTASAGAQNLATLWQRRLLWLAALWALALLAYRGTAWSMVDAWIEYDTYSHGFLILPISIWLIWERRERIVSLPPTLSYLALIAAGAAGLAWFAASIAYVQAVQQFALVALLIALVWFCVGNRAACEMMFPLAYLFFAIPVGEVLVPPMMEFTATQTVELVRLTGIPVYREGLYFSLPSGDWSVVKACSGVRYLIASLALGTIYAYLTYQSARRRLLFILAAIIVPIIANVLRAYMIVMLGHLSDMKIATGVDHLVYGWIFFGFVMLLLFWVGSWFAETEEAADASTAHAAAGAPNALLPLPTPVTVQVASLAGVVALVLLFPLMVAVLEQRTIEVPAGDLTITSMSADWTPIDAPPWSWRPPFHDANKQTHAFFLRDGRVFGISVGLYLQQKQGAEMISYRNGLIDKETEGWKVLGRRVESITTANGELDASGASLSGEGYSLSLYTWYDIGGYETANKYVAKLKELFDKATFSSTASARILVYAEPGPKGAAAGSTLDQFVFDARPRIKAAIARMTVSER